MQEISSDARQLIITTQKLQDYLEDFCTQYLQINLSTTSTQDIYNIPSGGFADSAKLLLFLLPERKEEIIRNHYHHYVLGSIIVFGICSRYHNSLPDAVSLRHACSALVSRTDSALLIKTAYLVLTSESPDIVSTTQAVTHSFLRRCETHQFQSSNPQ